MACQHSRGSLSAAGTGVEISQVQWAVFPLSYGTPLLPAQLVALLEALALPTILRRGMAGHLGHL